MSTASLVIKLTLYIFCGFAAVRSGTVSKDFFKPFSAFVMLIPMPALIIRSFYNTELTSEALQQFGSIITCTVVMLCTLAVVGMVVKKLHRNPSEAHICVYGMMTSNFNFFGLPIVEAMFGASGIFYYTILTTLARVVYYGFPPYLLGDGHKLNVKEFARQMICPPIIAIVVGMVCYLLRFQPPAVIDSVVDGLAEMASPCGMMLCGMTLANANLKEAFTNPMMLVTCVFRLLIAPAAVLAVLTLCGFDIFHVQLAIIYSMLPFGALMPTFATKYCSDPHSAIYGSVLVSTSTVLSIATVSLWITIMQSLFH